MLTSCNYYIKWLCLFSWSVADPRPNAAWSDDNKSRYRCIASHLNISSRQPRTKVSTFNNDFHFFNFPVCRHFNSPKNNFYFFGWKNTFLLHSVEVRIHSIRPQSLIKVVERRKKLFFKVFQFRNKFLLSAFRRFPSQWKLSLRQRYPL